MVITEDLYTRNNYTFLSTYKTASMTSGNQTMLHTRIAIDVATWFSSNLG